jgi:osmotically-inducible protein OsmY
MRRYISGSRLTQPRQNRFIDRQHASSAGPLSPPFYNARDEDPRLQYPREGRVPTRLTEDTSNYGRGGYYGNTYDQKRYLREGWDSERGSGVTGYRHLGDRRWSRNDESEWEREQSQRGGYRGLDERTETARLHHRGKGPRNYRRSDARIHEDLNDRLYDDPFLNATDIEVTVRDGEVVLSGTVENKQGKRRAEDIAEEVTGVRDVENRLRLGDDQARK